MFYHKKTRAVNVTPGRCDVDVNAALGLFRWNAELQLQVVHVLSADSAHKDVHSVRHKCNNADVCMISLLSVFFFIPAYYV